MEVKKIESGRDFMLLYIFKKFTSINIRITFHPIKIDSIYIKYWWTRTKQNLNFNIHLTIFYLFIPLPPYQINPPNSHLHEQVLNLKSVMP